MVLWGLWDSKPDYQHPSKTKDGVPITSLCLSEAPLKAFIFPIVTIKLLTRLSEPTVTCSKATNKGVERKSIKRLLFQQLGKIGDGRGLTKREKVRMDGYVSVGGGREEIFGNRIITVICWHFPCLFLPLLFCILWSDNISGLPPTRQKWNLRLLLLDIL